MRNENSALEKFFTVIIGVFTIGFIFLLQAMMTALPFVIGYFIIKAFTN